MIEQFTKKSFGKIPHSHISKNSATFIPLKHKKFNNEKRLVRCSSNLTRSNVSSFFQTEQRDQTITYVKRIRTPIKKEQSFQNDLFYNTCEVEKVKKIIETTRTKIVPNENIKKLILIQRAFRNFIKKTSRPKRNQTPNKSIKYYRRVTPIKSLAPINRKQNYYMRNEFFTKSIYVRINEIINKISFIQIFVKKYLSDKRSSTLGTFNTINTANSDMFYIENINEMRFCPMKERMIKFDNKACEHLQGKTIQLYAEDDSSTFSKSTNKSTYKIDSYHNNFSSLGTYNILSERTGIQSRKKISIPTPTAKTSRNKISKTPIRKKEYLTTNSLSNTENYSIDDNTYKNTQNLTKKYEKKINIYNNSRNNSISIDSYESNSTHSNKRKLSRDIVINLPFKKSVNDSRSACPTENNKGESEMNTSRRYCAERYIDDNEHTHNIIPKKPVKYFPVMKKKFVIHAETDEMNSAHNNIKLVNNSRNKCGDYIKIEDEYVPDYSIDERKHCNLKSGISRISEITEKSEQSERTTYKRKSISGNLSHHAKVSSLKDLDENKENFNDLNQSDISRESRKKKMNSNGIVPLPPEDKTSLKNMSRLKLKSSENMSKEIPNIPKSYRNSSIISQKKRFPAIEEVPKEKFELKREKKSKSVTTVRKKIKNTNGLQSLEDLDLYLVNVVTNLVSKMSRIINKHKKTKALIVMNEKKKEKKDLSMVMNKLSTAKKPNPQKIEVENDLSIDIVRQIDGKTPFNSGVCSETRNMSSTKKCLNDNFINENQKEISNTDFINEISQDLSKKEPEKEIIIENQIEKDKTSLQKKDNFINLNIQEISINPTVDKRIKDFIFIEENLEEDKKDLLSTPLSKPEEIIDLEIKNSNKRFGESEEKLSSIIEFSPVKTEEKIQLTLNTVEENENEESVQDDDMEMPGKVNTSCIKLQKPVCESLEMLPLYPGVANIFLNENTQLHQFYKVIKDKRFLPADTRSINIFIESKQINQNIEKLFNLQSPSYPLISIYTIPYSQKKNTLRNYFIISDSKEDEFVNNQFPTMKPCLPIKIENTNDTESALQIEVSVNPNGVTKKHTNKKLNLLKDMFIDENKKEENFEINNQDASSVMVNIKENKEKGNEKDITPIKFNDVKSYQTTTKPSSTFNITSLAKDHNNCFSEGMINTKPVSSFFIEVDSNTKVDNEKPQKPLETLSIIQKSSPNEESKVVKKCSVIEPSIETHLLTESDKTIEKNIPTENIIIIENNKISSKELIENPLNNLQISNESNGKSKFDSVPYLDYFITDTKGKETPLNITMNNGSSKEESPSEVSKEIPNINIDNTLQTPIKPIITFDISNADGNPYFYTENRKIVSNFDLGSKVDKFHTPKHFSSYEQKYHDVPIVNENTLSRQEKIFIPSKLKIVQSIDKVVQISHYKLLSQFLVNESGNEDGFSFVGTQSQIPLKKTRTMFNLLSIEITSEIEPLRDTKTLIPENQETSKECFSNKTFQIGKEPRLFLHNIIPAKKPIKKGSIKGSFKSNGAGRFTSLYNK